MGIIALFCTSISYSLLTAGAQRVNSTIASIVNMLEPLVCILVGTVFLKEIPSIKTIIGCTLVFSAIVITVLKKTGMQADNCLKAIDAHEKYKNYKKGKRLTMEFNEKLLA